MRAAARACKREETGYFNNSFRIEANFDELMEEESSPVPTKKQKVETPAAPPSSHAVTYSTQPRIMSTKGYLATG